MEYLHQAISYINFAVSKDEVKSRNGNSLANDTSYDDKTDSNVY